MESNHYITINREVMEFKAVLPERKKVIGYNRYPTLNKEVMEFKAVPPKNN